jgi:hypothetical protein
MMYFAVGIVGVFAPHLFGVLPHGYTQFDNVLHIALGIVGIGIAWVFYRREDKPAAHLGLA